MGTIFTVSKKILIPLCIISCLFPARWGDASEKIKIHSVGIVIDNSNFMLHVDSFKAGMAHFGYIENKNVEYILYILNDNGIARTEAQKILSDPPDILLALGNSSAKWAGKSFGGTDIPVLFSLISSDPVQEGIADSLSLPAGNITGIRVPFSIPKALEWLVASVPGVKKVYIPYNPDDQVSTIAMEGLEDVASRLGIELVFHKIKSYEEVLSTINTLPEDIDAMFKLPAVELNAFQWGLELNRAALVHKLPVGSIMPPDQEVLVNYSPDTNRSGRQAARMADQILRGANPADLPIETVEMALTINLKVADEIGLRIPNSVLVNAKTIIR